MTTGPIYSVNKRELRKHPPEVIDAIRSGSIEMWKSYRIPHLFKADGTPCSQGKDPCLIITKHNNRYAYLCHRCNVAGYVYTSELNTPGDAMKMLDYFKGEHKPVVLKLSDIKKLVKRGRRLYPESNPSDLDVLPNDFMLLSGRHVPEAVRAWLIRRKIPLNYWVDHKLGYSAKWDRIIFPIYTYVRNTENKLIHKRIVGWAGRCWKDMTKAERVEKHRPKWIVQKADDMYERLFFTAPREYGFSPHTPVVFVEDIISAIRIQGIMTHETVALLNTHLPYNLVSNYKDHIMVLWLDPDMKEKTMQYVKRFNSLGFRMGYIYSELDPKDMQQYDIRELINNAVVNVSMKEKVIVG